MMILIDSGNSRIKLGTFSEAAYAAQLAAQAVSPEGAAIAAAPIGRRDADSAAFDNTDIAAVDAWLAALPARATGAIGVNVAGDKQGEAIAAAFARQGVTVRWLRAQGDAYGLTNRYAQPQQLGADRWASLVGVTAHQAFGHGPFLLACFGTATTLDTVGPDNVFEGGMILPGPALMKTSLVSGTANLPLADGAVVDFPTDTHQAIASGVAAAQAGALMRQWLAGCRHYGQPPAVFVAGGGWPEVADETRRLLAEAAAVIHCSVAPIEMLEHPVLDGLAHIAATQAAEVS